MGLPAETSLEPYPSPEALYSDVERLAIGGELVRYGTSTQGRPLLAVRLPSPGRPRLLCSANIHGPEFIGALTALELLRIAQAGLPLDAELWVVPCLNPDGYARTWSQGGRGPLHALRTNANGVDLNRNYPRPEASPSWLPGAGSERPGDATYRGPSPLSEAETRALDELCREQAFHASANLHSFMGTVIPASVRGRRDFRNYKKLAAAFAQGQRKTRYRRLSSRLFDVFTGEQEDHQHHCHRTWAMCVECFPLLASFRQYLRAPSTFWRFNPRDPHPWVENDVPGLVAYFARALDLERPELR